MLCFWARERQKRGTTSEVNTRLRGHTHIFPVYLNSSGSDGHVPAALKCGEQQQKWPFSKQEECLPSYLGAIADIREPAMSWGT